MLVAHFSEALVNYQSNDYEGNNNNNNYYYYCCLHFKFIHMLIQQPEGQMHKEHKRIFKKNSQLDEYTLSYTLNRED